MKNSIIDNLDIIDFAQKSKAFDIDIFDNKDYGFVEVYGNENLPALFLKEVDSFDSETLKSIAEIHHDSWNFQKVLFLYVYTKTEIRIYNCSKKPFGYNKNDVNFNFDKELQKLEVFSCNQTDKEKLKTLNTLFSRIAIDTGFIWSAIEAKEIRDKLNLQNRVDKFLVKSLINVAEKLAKEDLKDKDIIHKLIMRSLFLLYLEDKKATTKEFYTEFLKDADSYFKVLENVDATYKLFERLAEDFNGSLFTITDGEKNIVKPSHLDLIKKCFINGYDNNNNNNNNQIILFEDWRLFDFKIIRIELLSEIYENFLSELDEKGKKDSGTFYTPPSLVELILNEKLPIKNNETNYNVKTLDPSCGSGIFLVQTFKRLVKRYENQHKKKLTDFNILTKILINNVFGIEIDEKSIKVAAFSLHLALLDNLDPRTGWWDGTIRFPNLINNPEDKTIQNQGNNLFKRDTISNFVIEKLQNFQLIVGNPPFGTKNLLPSIKEYCEKYNFAKEMVLPFLHKATLLAPQGEIALIFNTKVLTNTGGTYQNFREWLFNNTYVEKIYNFSILRKAPKNSGGQLFGSAVGPISIVFFKSVIPETPKETITYYAPKTYIKNDVLEGIIIDSSDEKHLPRIECKKKDSKIWKVSMWGSYFDFELIEKLDNLYITLGNYIKKNNKVWDCAKGIMSDSLKPDFIPIKIISPKLVERYSTKENALVSNQKFYRKIDDKFTKPPYLIFKEGQANKNYCASIIDFEGYFTNSLYGFSNNGDFRNSKVLCSYLNSIFVNYFLSLSTSTWGIERERINLNELLTVPSILDFINEKNREKLSILTDRIVSLKKSDKPNQDFSHLEKEIDEIIYNDILKLSVDEQIIINDTINYSLDLFEKQKKSDAVKPVLEVNHFTNRLTDDINEWLDDDNLKISATHYTIARNCPLYLIKLTFDNEKKEIVLSDENIYDELKKLDQKLWKEENQNLYFRKKLNYYDGNDIYIVKPNQKRFWSETAAMEDCKSLIVEILNMKE